MFAEAVVTTVSITDDAVTIIVRCALFDVVMTDFVTILVVNWVEETELVVDDIEDVILEDACADVDVVVTEEESENWLFVLGCTEVVDFGKLEPCDNVEVETKTDPDKLKNECECNIEFVYSEELVKVVSNVDADAELLELDSVLTLSLLT